MLFMWKQTTICPPWPEKVNKIVYFWEGLPTISEGGNELSATACWQGWGALLARLRKGGSWRIDTDTHTHTHPRMFGWDRRLSSCISASISRLFFRFLLSFSTITSPVLLWVTCGRHAQPLKHTHAWSYLRGTPWTLPRRSRCLASLSWNRWDKWVGRAQSELPRTRGFWAFPERELASRSCPRCLCRLSTRS